MKQTLSATSPESCSSQTLRVWRWGFQVLGFLLQSTHMPTPTSTSCSVVQGCFLFPTSCVPAKWLQSCPTLCDPRDRSPPDSSVQGLLRNTGVAMLSSRGSSQPRDLQWRNWKIKISSLHPGSDFSCAVTHLSGYFFPKITLPFRHKLLFSWYLYLSVDFTILPLKS